MCQEPYECFLSSYSERRPGASTVSRYRLVELEECRSGKLAPAPRIASAQEAPQQRRDWEEPCPPPAANLLANEALQSVSPGASRLGRPSPRVPLRPTPVLPRNCRPVGERLGRQEGGVSSRRRSGPHARSCRGLPGAGCLPGWGRRPPLAGTVTSPVPCKQKHLFFCTSKTSKIPDASSGGMRSLMMVSSVFPSRPHAQGRPSHSCSRRSGRTEHRCPYNTAVDRA